MVLAPPNIPGLSSLAPSAEEDAQWGVAPPPPQPVARMAMPQATGAADATAGAYGGGQQMPTAQPAAPLAPAYATPQAQPQMTGPANDAAVGAVTGSGSQFPTIRPVGPFGPIASETRIQQPGSLVFTPLEGGPLLPALLGTAGSIAAPRAVEQLGGNQTEQNVAGLLGGLGGSLVAPGGVSAIRRGVVPEEPSTPAGGGVFARKPYMDENGILRDGSGRPIGRQYPWSESNPTGYGKPEAPAPAASPAASSPPTGEAAAGQPAPAGAGAEPPLNDLERQLQQSLKGKTPEQQPLRTVAEMRTALDAEGLNSGGTQSQVISRYRDMLARQQGGINMPSENVSNAARDAYQKTLERSGDPEAARQAATNAARIEQESNARVQELIARITQDGNQTRTDLPNSPRPLPRGAAGINGPGGREPFGEEQAQTRLNQAIEEQKGHDYYPDGEGGVVRADRNTPEGNPLGLSGPKSEFPAQEMPPGQPGLFGPEQPTFDQSAGAEGANPAGAPREGMTLRQQLLNKSARDNPSPAEQVAGGGEGSPPKGATPNDQLPLGGGDWLPVPHESPIHYAYRAFVDAFNGLTNLVTLGHWGVLRQGFGSAVSDLVTHAPAFKQLTGTQGESATLRALGNLWTVLKNPEAMAEIQTKLNADPFVRAARDSGYFHESDPNQLNPTVVRQVLSHIPFGDRTQASARIYIETLRKMLYSNEAQKLSAQGITDEGMYHGVWNAVSDVTGHGFRGQPTPNVGGVNPVFSLQAVAGTWRSLTDLFTSAGREGNGIGIGGGYNGGNPLGAGSRSVALKNAVGLAGAIAAIQGVGYLTGAGSINWNLVNTPLGKLKVGYSTIDPSGTYQSAFRLMAQEAQFARDGNRGAMVDAATQYAQGKLGPTSDLLIGSLSGQDALGRPFSLTGDAKKNWLRDYWAPIAANAIYDAYRANGVTGAAAALPSLGAMSVSTNIPTADQRDKEAQRLGLKDFATADKAQKQQIDTNIGHMPSEYDVQTLSTVAAVDHYAEMYRHVFGHDVMFNSLKRPVNQNGDSIDAWNASKNTLDSYFNGLAAKYGDQIAKQNYGKAFADLPPAEQTKISTALHTEAQKQNPELDAWLLWWGGSTKLESQAALTALQGIVAKYGNKSLGPAYDKLFEKKATP